MNKKVIAIIPARGGSKGIKNKNTIEVGGKPLVAWTIEQALNSSKVEEVYVSTNDDKIAAVSESYGAKIIKRPKEISNDTSSSEEAIINTLNQIEENEKYIPTLVVFLQATSPLRLKNDIDNAIDYFINSGSDSLFSGSVFEDFLFWKKNGDDWDSVNYDYKNRGMRQDRPPQFAENGSIYIFTPELIRKYKNRLGENFTLFPMKFWQTWQIDTEEDIDIIEYFLEKKVNIEQKAKVDDIDLIVYDFDGVMTNNKAIVDDTGKESVMVNRGDGLAIAEIKKMNISQIILSTEKSVVVQKRAEKIKIPFIQGVNNKKVTLTNYLERHNIELNKVAYIGNDINDLDVMKIVGIPISPADGAPEVKRVAKIITQKNGGDGVIREIYDMLK
jgi:YrbI family 3-deoxy-D-manno-octulosonate 8-phosphate phosphatase